MIFTGGNSSTPTECILCHQDNYQSAPNHVISGYPQDCAECHSSFSSWEQVSFNHSSFDFRGAHSALKDDCSICHGNAGKIQAGTSESDCYNCHSSSGIAISSYEKTKSPSHTALSFSTTCTDCHSINAWSGAGFSHPGFNLTGVHTTLDCNACHSSGYPGQYAGLTEDDCFACHESTYYEKHKTCPQDCALCHNLFNWGNPDDGLRESLGCK